MKSAHIGEFARALRAIREDREWSQATVAAAIGSTRHQVSRWEAGRVGISEGTVAKLAAAYGYASSIEFLTDAKRIADRL